MNKADLKKMTPIERVQVMEMLWDVMLHDEDIETPSWHEDILKERRESIKNGSAEFITLAELKAIKKQ